VDPEDLPLFLGLQGLICKSLKTCLGPDGPVRPLEVGLARPERAKRGQTGPRFHNACFGPDLSARVQNSAFWYQNRPFGPYSL